MGKRPIGGHFVAVTRGIPRCGNVASTRGRTGCPSGKRRGRRGTSDLPTFAGRVQPWARRVSGEEHVSRVLRICRKSFDWSAPIATIDGRSIWQAPLRFEQAAFCGLRSGGYNTGTSRRKSHVREICWQPSRQRLLCVQPTSGYGGRSLPWSDQVAVPVACRCVAASGSNDGPATIHRARVLR